MKTRTYILLLICILFFCPITESKAQDSTNVWTLEECIDYALEQNIEVKKTVLTTDINRLNADQSKSNRLPSLSVSAMQNFNWNKGLNATNDGYTSKLNGSNSSNYNVSSSVSLYNGSKLNNRIKQSELDLESGIYYSESIKESIGISILNAYLRVLYANELIANTEKQIEATNEQLVSAQERLDIGIISKSDYLQIKSELATEKLTLANAKSQYALEKINLMQLMELPVDQGFMIQSPELQDLLNQNLQPKAKDVYNIALEIKPQVKNAELNKESAKLDEKIAKADLFPLLSMNAGMSTGYSKINSNNLSQINSFDYFEQLNNNISPSAGLSLSIPIFQKKQVKTNIALAKIGSQNAELDEINTKNQLRKDIEQTCQDVISAQSEYAASLEQLESTNESYQVSTEKYNNGLINSVDYLFEKTNLITSESKLLQSKYNLIFTYKILDFYKGIPLSL